MKLIYLTSARIPDDVAHPLQILTMCESFAKAGIEVELVAPHRSRTPDVDPYRYAGVDAVFKITKLPCIDLFAGTQNSFLFYVRTVSFLIAAKAYLLAKRYDILYTREHLAGLLFRNFVYEVHSRPNAGKGLYERFWNKVRAFIVLTDAMKRTYEEAGIPSRRIFVAPDATKIEPFEVSTPKEVLRDSLGLPEDRFLIGYVGTLKTMNMEKGIATALQALARLPARYLFVVVGGVPHDIDEYRHIAQSLGVADRVRFVGKVPHELVPSYLHAFDTVVAPFPDFEHYRYYMSPLKIFEYMAAGVPMIVSDLPSLREVLTDRTARFVPPSDGEALAAEIVKLDEHPDAARALAQAAQDEARTRFSWTARARGILAFVRSVRD